MVLTLGLLASFGPLCLDMYLAALPQLPGDLGGTATSAQLSLTACLVGLAVGQLATGPLSDRIGRRIPLLVGVGLFVTASALCALTSSMTVFLVLRFVQGACGAAGIVLARATVADRLSGAAAASLYASIAAVNALAPILAPLLGGQILRFGSWRPVFWVLAAIGVLMVVLILTVVDESLPPERRRGGGWGEVAGGFGRLLRDPVYVGLTMSAALIMAAMFGYISASPFLLQDGFGLSEAEFSSSFAANAVGIAVASRLTATLVRRTSSTRVLGWAVTQSLIGSVILAIATWTGAGLVPVLLGLFVMVSAVGFAAPTATALAMDRHREIAGSASALFGLAQFIFGAVTAPLVGWGDPASGLALGVVSLVATSLAVVAWASTRR